MNWRTLLVGLIEFAEKGGYSWRVPVEGGNLELPWKVEFALLSGDTDIYCFQDNEKYVVRDRNRGSFSAPEIVSDHVEDIEKFLSFAVGNAVRYRSGLPHIELESAPIAVGAEVEGFLIEGEPRDTTLSWVERDSARRVSGLGRFDASKFIRYSRFSADEIRASFLATDGHPMFKSVARIPE